MDCVDVRDALLNGESLRPADLPPSVVVHLERCPRCTALLEEIAALERSWRESPLPADANANCDASKAVFLQRLAAGMEPIETTVTRTDPKPTWRLPVWRLALAASFLGLAFFTAWLTMPRHDGNSEVMDRLVDWNIRLADAPEARKPEVVAKEREKLETLVRAAQLSDEDRALAKSMLEASTFLAKNDDPLAAADRFDQLAEQMQTRVDLADQTGDLHAVDTWVKRVGSISERGVRAQLDRSKKRNQDPKQRQRFESIAANDLKRQQAVNRIAERETNRGPGKKWMKGKK